MTGDDILARLVAQADARGADFADLCAVIETASEAGAVRALDRLGLADASAQDDLRELRQLLGAWRDAKTSARKAVVDWVVRGMLALLLVGIVVKLGLAGMLR